MLVCMAMRLYISPSEGVPIYLQIIQQIRRGVASGELSPGEELPSIRALADRLVVNPNTVARAYRELEIAGVVTTSRGMGTYIADAMSASESVDRLEVLRPKVDALVVESRQLRVKLEELTRLVEERDAALGPRLESETGLEENRG